MAYSHHFIETEKKMPGEEIPSQIISGNFHGDSWISSKKRSSINDLVTKHLKFEK